MFVSVFLKNWKFFKKQKQTTRLPSPRVQLCHQQKSGILLCFMCVCIYVLKTHLLFYGINFSNVWQKSKSVRNR